MPFRPVLAALPLTSIKVTDAFWHARQETVRNVTLKHAWQQIESTGRLENFKHAAAKEGDHTSKYCFDDSDVYKWLEACAYALRLGPENELQGLVDAAVTAIAEAQEATGYIDTFFQLRHPQLKFCNLISMHEMYCAGHLIEAAVALEECCGDRRLLDVAIKLADLLVGTFGPVKRLGYCGHEEIELALMRLAGVTGNQTYSELADWFVNVRGSRPSPFALELEDAEAMKLSPYARRMHSTDGVYTGEYCQDHAPVRDHTEVVGHAVRAMYLYIAATQTAAKSEDQPLSDAMLRTWENLTGRRMYITGGIGPSGENEGFTADFDLPNSTAYAETCAAVGLVFWGQKLLHATGNADYANVMERALYNGALAGISLSGDRFFYANPLESRGKDQRVPWFECACCPPNIARLIGSVGAYAIGASTDAFWIHMPISLEADVIFSGVPTKIKIESDYPWSGKVVVKVDPERPNPFELRIRIPDWADEVESDVPGLEQEADYEDGYAIYRKHWKAGDTLTFDFGMKPRWISADPRVRDNLGRAALTCGPLVYCAESHDSGFAPQLFVADHEAELAVTQSEALGGFTQFKVAGAREDDDAQPELYNEAQEPSYKESELVMIPYALWANRGPCEMQVWLRRQ